MGCGQKNRTVVARAGAVRTLSWEPATIGNTRWLLVSNNPETIPSEVSGTIILPANLYKGSYKIPPSGSLTFRVFLWHGHEYDSPHYFHLVAKLTGNTVNGHIAMHRFIQNTADVPKLGLLHLQGICCAKAQRNGTYDPHLANPTLPNGTQRVLATYTVPPRLIDPDGNIVPLYACKIHEFTVNGEAGSTFSLRTSISADATDPGDEATPIVNANLGDQHIRGSWPYSALQSAAPEPIDLYTMAGPVRFEICANGGPEMERFLPRIGDTGALANNGLYGVNIRYEIPIVNTSPAPTQHYLFEIHLRGRNLPQKYFGSVVDEEYAGIPPLANGEAIVLLPETNVGQDIPVFFLDNATGGACATPVDLVINWRPI